MTRQKALLTVLATAVALFKGSRAAGEFAVLEIRFDETNLPEGAEFLIVRWKGETIRISIDEAWEILKGDGE